MDTTDANDAVSATAFLLPIVIPDLIATAPKARELDGLKMGD